MQQAGLVPCLAEGGAETHTVLHGLDPDSDIAIARAAEGAGAHRTAPDIRKEEDPGRIG